MEVKKTTSRLAKKGINWRGKMLMSLIFEGNAVMHYNLPIVLNKSDNLPIC